jgi:prepilin-type N-terminal cleavage/methylation domain-containing protein
MRTSQRGMTLLEIMIVLAILALVMGLVIGPKVLDNYRDSQRRVARLAVHKLADEDYPMWSVAHASTPCPDGLAELSSTERDLTDPWGTSYKMYCGPTAPAPTVAFGAASFGQDLREGTVDDIRSW